MKRRYHIVALLLSVCMLVATLGNVALAANGSVTLSGGSAEVGKTVTVSGTVKCSKGAIGAATVTLTYDPAGLKFVSGSSGTNGGSGSVVYSGYGDGSVKSLSFTLKFKVLKEGSHTISGVADAYNFDEQQLTMNVSSATIKGTVVETEEPKEDEPVDNTPGNTPGNQPTNNKKSSNTKLSELKVYPGTLSPAFSADVRKYTVQVDSDVEEVTISATTKSSKATFYVSGGTNLKEGENVAKVVVTAEDGTTNSYTITIHKGKVNHNLTIVNIGDNSYTIDETFDAEDMPDGFVATKIMYDKAAYNGAALADGTMKLFNLKDAEGKAAFYVYDDKAKSFYPFVQIALSKTRSIILQPLDTTGEAPSGMSATTLLLEEHQWDVWGDKSGEYYLVNTRNREGQLGLYRYDMLDGTYQRYEQPSITTEQMDVKGIDSILPESVTAYIVTYFDYFLIGIAGVIAVLVVIMFALAANADKRRKKRREKIERWKERRHPWE